MHHENSQHTLHDYRQGLYQETGKLVTRLLKAKNKIRGSIRKLNQVPIDKLKPNNVLCAMEYDELIDMLPAINIKFADIRNPLNSLTAIGAHKRQLFNEFHW